jgi:hypothetical protein
MLNTDSGANYSWQKPKQNQKQNQKQKQRRNKIIGPVEGLYPFSRFVNFCFIFSFFKNAAQLIFNF